MEWKEVTPEQKNWDRQINIVAYDGNIIVGSIVCENDIGWQSVIDGHMDMLHEASTEVEAKAEMYEVLDGYLESQINYYQELREKLDDL